MAGSTKPNLEQFASRLEAALGDNLVALLLFGSAARGTHVAGRSDRNVLVIGRASCRERVFRTV